MDSDSTFRNGGLLEPLSVQSKAGWICTGHTEPRIMPQAQIDPFWPRSPTTHHVIYVWHKPNKHRLYSGWQPQRGWFIINLFGDDKWKTASLWQAENICREGIPILVEISVNEVGGVAKNPALLIRISGAVLRASKSFCMLLCEVVFTVLLAILCAVSRNFNPVRTNRIPSPTPRMKAIAMVAPIPYPPLAMRMVLADNSPSSLVGEIWGYVAGCFDSIR